MYRTVVMAETKHLSFLHADACGFTAAMQSSDSRALSRLAAGQRLLAKCAAAYGGYAKDMAGDSSLMVFESAKSAFLAGRRFQAETGKLEAELVENRPLPYRMGLSSGKATLLGGEIYGQAINLAARIQSLVSPGSIGVDSSLWDGIQPGAGGAVIRQRVLFAKHEEPAVQFVEVSGPGAGSVASGWHEDVSRNEPFVRVIAWSDGVRGRLGAIASESVLWECSSLFAAYDWRCRIVTPETLEIGEFSDEHRPAGADYTVRMRFTERQGNLRISISLVTHHDRRGFQNFTREVTTEPEVVNAAIDLTSLVVSAIVHCETYRAWHGKGIGSFQLALAGRQMLSGFNSEAIAAGFGLLRKGLSLDPEYPYLLSSLSRAHAIAWRFGWAKDGQDHLERAHAYAESAIKLAPNDPRCRADLAFVKFWNNEAPESVWHYERSLTALPFHPEIAADAGMVFSSVGRNDEAASILERSVANLPVDADYRLWSLGDVYFDKRDYKSSLTWLNRMSDRSQAQRLLAATTARLGLDTRPHVEAVLRQQPDFSVNRWIAIQPLAREEVRADYREALLIAGLPL
jgi:adenylate cyclase